MKVITIDPHEKKHLSAFLSLPKKLYNKKELTNNYKEERQLLTKSHVLSHYFEVQALLVVSAQNKPLARCIVTSYKSDLAAYIGLFECVNDTKVANLLFEAAQNYCKSKGKTQIIGPVDGSIWVSYRLKCDNFGKPYTGEPYNKSYYKALFEQSNFIVHKRYFSNIYSPDALFENAKAKKRLEDKLNEGYIFKSPTKSELEKQLSEIYALLMLTYKNFPAYKPLTEGEFLKLFGKIGTIADFSMVKLAYFKGELVGFFISVPNYGSTLLGRINVIKLMQFLYKKKHAKNFIIMYVGVKKGHAGLGTAMAELIKKQILARQLTCTGALIQEGKVTARYFGSDIERKITYELFSKDLQSSRDIT